MKMKNNKFRVNAIDIFVLLLVVIVALGIGYRFKAGKQMGVSGKDKYEVTFVVRGVREDTANYLVKGQPYSDISDKNSTKFLGKSFGGLVTESYGFIAKMDGTIVKAVMPRKDVFINVEIDGSELTDGFYTSSKRALAVGSRVTLNGKFATAEAKVYEMKKVSE